MQGSFAQNDPTHSSSGDPASNHTNQVSAQQLGPLTLSDMMGLHGYKLICKNNSFVQIWREEAGQLYMATTFYMIDNTITAIPAGQQGAATTSVPVVKTSASAKNATPTSRVTRSQKRFQNVTPPGPDMNFDQYLNGEFELIKYTIKYNL